jgi:hypothetical protein
LENSSHLLQRPPLHRGLPRRQRSKNQQPPRLLWRGQQ